MPDAHLTINRSEFINNYAARGGGAAIYNNGGTINIITSTTTAEPRIDGGAHVTDYGGYTSYGSVYMKAKRQYVAGMYLVNSGAAFLPAWLPGFRFL